MNQILHAVNENPNIDIWVISGMVMFIVFCGILFTMLAVKYIPFAFKIKDYIKKSELLPKNEHTKNTNLYQANNAVVAVIAAAYHNNRQQKN